MKRQLSKNNQHCYSSGKCKSKLEWDRNSHLLELLFSRYVQLFGDPRGLQPPRLHCPWGFPGKNTGVDCHFFLQGIFLTQGSNPCLLHWQVFYHWAIKEVPPVGMSLLKKPSSIKYGEAVEKRKPLAQFVVIHCCCSFCCSVTKLCPILWDPMDCSTSGSCVLYYLLKFAQIHVHWVSDAI